MEQEYKKIAIWTTIAVIVVILVVTLFNCISTIPTGFIGVKTQFGKVQESMINEGFNFKAPFIEKIVKIDCRTQKFETAMEASSKDLQKVNQIKIAVNYNVDKTMANKLYKEIGIDFKSVIIEPAIYETVKSVFANYTAEELITKRNEVSAMATELLFNRLSNRGINITTLNIIDLSFSAEFDAAIEQKQVVEQNTQKARYELEKAKVENEKKIAEAEANAKVMELQNKQITEQTLKLKQLEIQQALINKWNGQLPTTSLGDNIPMLNLK